MQLCDRSDVNSNKNTLSIICKYYATLFEYTVPHSYDSQELHRNMSLRDREARIQTGPQASEGNLLAPCMPPHCLQQIAKGWQGPWLWQSGQSYEMICKPRSPGWEAFRLQPYLFIAAMALLTLIFLPKSPGLGKENTLGKNVIKPWNHSEDQAHCISNQQDEKVHRKNAALWALPSHAIQAVMGPHCHDSYYYQIVCKNYCHLRSALPVMSREVLWIKSSSSWHLLSLPPPQAPR